MTDQKYTSSKDAPINPVDVPIEEKQRQLEGERPRDDQSAILDQSDTDGLEQLTPTDQYEAEPAAGVSDALPDDPEAVELLTERELREGETDDPFKAAEEGQAYIPPIDPPTVPSDDYESAKIASGMGMSAFGEPYNDDTHTHLISSDEMRERMYDALRADSSTSAYADQVIVTVRGDTVILRGMVSDLVDVDNLIAVARYVEGVAEVIDELQVISTQV